MLAIARFQKMRKGSIFSNLIQMLKQYYRLLYCWVAAITLLSLLIGQ